MRIPQIKLENPNIEGLTNALDTYPKHYKVYVAFCDSIYLVLPQDTEESEEDILYIHSIDTRSDVTYTNCVQELMEVLYQYEKNITVRLAAAENLDEELDMQMLENCDICGITVCDICKDVYIIAS